MMDLQRTKELIDLVAERLRLAADSAAAAKGIFDQPHVTDAGARASEHLKLVVLETLEHLTADVSSWRAAEVLTPPPRLAFACAPCGACCIAEGEHPFVADVSSGDLEQLTPGERALLIEREGVWLTPVKRTEDGHSVCVFLEGEIGKATQCGLYERRPTNCRTFEVGGCACVAVRKRSGLPILSPTLEVAP